MIDDEKTKTTVPTTDPVDKASELTSQERAAKITYKLAKGKKMTTGEIAKELGVTWHGASKMMNTISRTIPIYRSGQNWTM